MNIKNIKTATIKKVEKEFNQDTAHTIAGLSKKLNIHFYTTKLIIQHLLLEGKIKRVPSTARGELFMKMGCSEIKKGDDDD